MRCKRCEHPHECARRLAREPRRELFVLKCVERIDQLHDGGDCRVEHEAVAHVLCDLLDGRVEHAAELRLLCAERCRIVGRRRTLDRLCELSEDAPHAPEEAVCPLDALIAPVKITIHGRGKEDEEPCRIRTVAVDDLLGRDDVAERLRHLRAVLDDHALREEVRERLVEVKHPCVAQYLREEACIEKMQDRVLDAADVLIDGRPVVHLVAVKGTLRVLRIRIAVVVPRGADKGVHRIRLTRRITAARGTFTVEEVFARRER